MQNEYQQLMDSIEYYVSLAQTFTQEARSKFAEGSVVEGTQALERASNCNCEVRILFTELAELDRELARETRRGPKRVIESLIRLRTSHS
jgi:hypothetical protein